LFSRVAHVLFWVYLLNKYKMDVANAENNPAPAESNVDDKEKTEQRFESVVKTEEAEKAGNEFEYLERNEFTSEIFKIEVKNLGYFGIGVSC